MARAATKAKTQQKSITSFFGAGATPTKRKAVDDEGEQKPTKKETADAAEEAAAEEEEEEELPPPVKKKAAEEEAPAKKRKVEEPQPAEKEDVVMAEADQEEEEEEDEAKETKVVAPSRAKVGRRRLRQRIVEEDESSDDDAMDLSGPAKKKNEVVEIQDDEEEEEDAAVEAVKHKAEVSTVVKKAEEPKTVNKVEEVKAVRKTSTPKKVQAVAEPEKDEANDDDEEEEAYVPEEEGDDAEENGDDDVDMEEEEEEKDVKPKKKKGAAKKSTSPTAPGSFFTGKTTPAAKKDTAKADTRKAANTDTAVAPLDDDVDGIPYTALAALFSKIEISSSRLVIQDLLSNFFREVLRKAPHDLLACIYLCVCTDLAPPFENLKIGIGDAILMKAIGEATGTNPKFIKDMYQKEGDLGKVAQNARSKQNTLSFAALKPAAGAKVNVLSVPDVYNQFVKIAKMTGNNSQAQKCSIIKGLLVKCEKDKKGNGQKSEQAAEAAKYIIRGLQGKLRIGLAEKSILMGLTYAFMLEKDAKDKEKQEKALASVKKAFAECPSYNALVKAFQDVQEQVETRPFLKVEDFTKVAELCVLTPGTPVSPMLARPTKAYAMVFDRFQGQPFTCEYKYDGERAQIHILPNGEIAIFSRNFENSTERFPDVKLVIAKAAKKGKITSCIVDAEVVAVDKATNKRLPFQVLSTRSRKNVKVEDIKVPVCIYGFDLLFLNGESLLKEPLAKRRELLKEQFEIEDGSFELATSLDVDGVMPGSDDAEAMEIAVDKVRTFLEEAVKENCEGLMVKTLEKDATYEPANRSHKWLKLKKDYLDGIGDSTDLVPIGAFHGRGKRTGVYGAYLLACYDPETEMYQPITKLGTGLNDEQLKDFHAQLKEKVTDKPHRDYAITDAIKPDVWFEPSVVWEILGADLSISPKYTAAIGHVAKDKGISLRFPRFIRIRDDKDATQSTSSSQIADLYRAQGLATVGGDEDDDDMLI